jgi:hypothetical protein
VGNLLEKKISLMVTIINDEYSARYFSILLFFLACLVMINMKDLFVPKKYERCICL